MTQHPTRRLLARAAVFALAPILAAALLFASCKQADDYAVTRAYKVKKRTELIGGPKALGNIGDYILENDKIRVLINGHPTDMFGGSPNKWGGSILDADIQRPEELFKPGERQGHDALMEVIPIMDVKTFGFDNIYDSGPVVRVPQDAIEILSDGADGGTARIQVSGTIHNLLGILGIIPVPLNSLPVKSTTVYSLAPGDNHVKITTTFTLLKKDGGAPESLFPVPLLPVNGKDNPITSMFTGSVFGDAVFYGDSLEAIGPGVFGFAPSFYQQDLYDKGQSVFSDTPLLDFSAGVNKEIGYGLVASDSPLAFPVMEDFLTIAFQKMTEPGFALPPPVCFYTYTRYLVVDEGDVAGILDHVVDLKSWDHGRVSGRVFDEITGEAVSGAEVLVFRYPRLTADGAYVPFTDDYDEMTFYLASLPAGAADASRLIPYSRFRTDSRRTDTAMDGSFEGKLPVDATTGEAHYILMAAGPGNVKSKLANLHIVKGETKEVALALAASGKIAFSVRSRTPAGPEEPCKVTIIGLDGEGRPDPYIGEGFLPAGEAKVVQTLNGKGEVTLPPGSYRLIASRGPEYTLDEQEVDVDPGKTRDVDLFIERVVDTSGWIAADMHMHTEKSPDSGLKVEDRLLSCLSEGLDLVASTDHDVITNYRPALEDMGAADLIKVLPGEELSNMDYAHFNSYPLRYNQTETSGGAVNYRLPSPTATLPNGDPMPLYTPQDCFDALRGLGDRDMVQQDPIIVANHTQETFTGYLRSFGFEQYSNTFGTPDIMTLMEPVIHNGAIFSTDGSKNFSFDFDAIELLNGKRLSDFRTATVEEVAESAFGQPAPQPSPLLPTLIRTADEQRRILTGDLLLDHTNRGMVDDYMSLLAMGKRVAGLGNSDSHDAFKTEGGKCRNYVMSSTDDPRFIDVNEFIANEKAGRVIATTGPFVESWVDGLPIGADVYDPTGTIDVRIKAQAPPQMSFDRIEIYGNGILIGEIGRDAGDNSLGCETSGLSIKGKDSVVRFDETVKCHIDRDTFVNVIGIGYEGMSPYINPQEGPSIEITDTLIMGVNRMIEEWLGIANIIPAQGTLARNHDNYPFAVTNAIFVDTDGVDTDGDGRNFDPPGYIPGWFDASDVPADMLKDKSFLTRVFAAKQKMLSITGGLRQPTGGAPDAGSDEEERHAAGCGG